MSTKIITVRLRVNSGETYQGEIPVHDVVHLALDRLLPHSVLHGHRLSVYKGQDLIYPDMFLYEILAHYGDADFDVRADELDLITVAPFTNYGFDHLAIALEDRQAAKREVDPGLRILPTAYDPMTATPIRPSRGAQYLKHLVDLDVGYRASDWPNNVPRSREARVRSEGSGTSEWRQINTAPKNEYVLVFCPDATEGSQIMICGHLVFVGDPDGPTWYELNCDARPYPLDVEPTHWMPLPNIPLAAALVAHGNETSGSSAVKP